MTDYEGINTVKDAILLIRRPEFQDKSIVIRKTDDPSIFATYWADRFGWQMCWSKPDAYNLDTVRVAEDVVAEAVFAAAGRSVISHEHYVEYVTAQAPTVRRAAEREIEMKDNFIARTILENAGLTKSLDRAEITMYKYTDANRFFNPELDVPVSERTVTIEDAAAALTERFENARVCALEAIGAIDNMTGEECVDVIRQYNAFVSNAKRQVEFAVECETVDFVLSPDYVRQSLRIALGCPDLKGEAE